MALKSWRLLYYFVFRISQTANNHLIYPIKQNYIVKSTQIADCALIIVEAYIT